MQEIVLPSYGRIKEGGVFCEYDEKPIAYAAGRKGLAPFIPICLKRTVIELLTGPNTLAPSV